jgi:hypothetical protein
VEDNLQLECNNKLAYKLSDNSLEDVISLYLDNKITENQVKGMCLEICTYIALQNLGIFPIPLHNQFNERYPYDSHLGIDLIFYHKSKLHGIECKNIAPRWSINKSWIDREIISRFDKLKGIIPIDIKIVLTSVDKDVMLKYLSKDYEVLGLGYQVYTEDMSKAIFPLSKLFSSLFNKNDIEHIEDKNIIPQSKLDSSLVKQIDTEYSTVLGHGSNESKVYSDKLRYVQTKLKELYDDTKQD